MIIPCKTVKDIKNAINIKKVAFMSRNKEEIKLVQKNLKRAIRQGKKNFKERVENKLRIRDPKGLWMGLKSITGCGPVSSNIREGTFTPDDANQFFALFETTDLSHKVTSTHPVLPVEDRPIPCPPHYCHSR